MGGTSGGGESGAAAGKRFLQRALQAAAQVHAELPELAPDQAGQLGGELDRLLTVIGQADPADEQRYLDEVFELLSVVPAAQRRFAELLTLSTATRSLPDYSALEGDPVSGYDRWLCPDCGYAFPVIDVEIRPPARCPNDGAALRRRRADG